MIAGAVQTLVHLLHQLSETQVGWAQFLPTFYGPPDGCLCRSALQIKTVFIRVYEAGGGQIPRGQSVLVFPSGATPKQCSQSCVQKTACCCSKTDIAPKNSQDYELMLWSESNYTGPQTWPMWYPASPPETTVALFVVEVQHWGLIILSFCVFGSWEGDVAGEGLAQALSEVWEVQKDAVSRGTCRGEAPGIHSQQYRQRYPLVFNVCEGFWFWLHFVKSDSLLILQYFF